MQVTQRGVEVAKDPEVMQAVRRDLVVRPFNPQQAFPQSFRVFAETPSKVIVPLHWARKALAHLRLTDARPPRPTLDLRFAGHLKPELRQPEAVRAVTDAWAARGGALLCLPTGYGEPGCRATSLLVCA